MNSPVAFGERIAFLNVEIQFGIQARHSSMRRADCGDPRGFTDFSRSPAETHEPLGQTVANHHLWTEVALNPETCLP